MTPFYTKTVPVQRTNDMPQRIYMTRCHLSPGMRALGRTGMQLLLIPGHTDLLARYFHLRQTIGSKRDLGHRIGYLMPGKCGGIHAAISAQSALRPIGDNNESF